MVEELKILLLLLNEEYDFIDNWGANGCIHGFKPAKDCPNKDCKEKIANELWDKLMVK